MKHFAVLGESLSHTLSPDIHSRIFKLLGLDCSYGVLEVSRADFKGIRNILTHKAYSGINVTIPYKELIIPYLDHISPEASRIGAVNTVSIEKGLLTGYNTDYYGFKLMLKHRGIEVKDKDITVFGSGGGAKAVIAYLIDGKAKSVNVVSRNKPQLLTLKERFREINILTREHEILGDVAVNCTPVGMYPHICNSIIDSKIASSFEALVDLVYNPVETQFLATGRSLSKKTANGLYMLVAQAVKADEIFLGISIDDVVVDDIYKWLAKRFI